MFQLIIKCDDDIIVRVQNSDASNFKYSVLVVVIVVHYYCSIQSSVLRTNQDFHTQMWQEKSDLGTMNKNGFNRTFVFRSYVHHSNHVPSNGAFTTRFTWLNAYLPKSSSRDMDPRPEYANPFQFGIHLNSCLSKSVNGIDRFGLVYKYTQIYINMHKYTQLSQL